MYTEMYSMSAACLYVLEKTGNLVPGKTYACTRHQRHGAILGLPHGKTAAGYGKLTEKACGISLERAVELCAEFESPAPAVDPSLDVSDDESDISPEEMIQFLSLQHREGALECLHHPRDFSPPATPPYADSPLDGSSSPAYSPPSPTDGMTSPAYSPTSPSLADSPTSPPSPPLYDFCYDSAASRAARLASIDSFNAHYTMPVPVSGTDALLSAAAKRLADFDDDEDDQHRDKRRVVIIDDTTPFDDSSDVEEGDIEILAPPPARRVVDLTVESEMPVYRRDNSDGITVFIDLTNEEERRPFFARPIDIFSGVSGPRVQLPGLRT